MDHLVRLKQGMSGSPSWRYIHLVIAQMLVICCLTGCIHRHQAPLAACLPFGANERSEVTPPLPAPSGDAIDGIQVRQLDGDSLTQGENAKFAVRVWYTLGTADEALLSLNLNQFQNHLSCVSEKDLVGSVPAKAGADSLVKIDHGKHAIDFLVTLKAGEVNGAIVKNGAVSFESSMWRAKPRYKFLTRRFGTDFCLQFK
jgi:hypothetical protein